MKEVVSRRLARESVDLDYSRVKITGIFYACGWIYATERLVTGTRIYVKHDQNNVKDILAFPVYHRKDGVSIKVGWIPANQCAPLMSKLIQDVGCEYNEIENYILLGRVIEHNVHREYGGHETREIIVELNDSPTYCAHL